MAFHFPLPGHTEPVVGALYKPSWGMQYAPVWKLKRYNPTLGICLVTQEPPYGGVLYVSVGDLQRWHLVRRPGESQT